MGEQGSGRDSCVGCPRTSQVPLREGQKRAGFPGVDGSVGCPAGPADEGLGWARLGKAGRGVCGWQASWEEVCGTEAGV